VRRLNVYSTPTVAVLAPDGRIVRQASGQPRKADVIAALGQMPGWNETAGAGGAAQTTSAGD